MRQESERQHRHPWRDKDQADRGQLRRYEALAEAYGRGDGAN